MAQQRGSTVQLGMQVESAFATNPGSPNLTLIPFTSESIKAGRASIIDETITSSRNSKKAQLQNWEVSGSIDCNLSETSHAWLIKALLGTNVTTGASDPYTHTIKVGPLYSYTLEKQFDVLTKFHLYQGLKFNKGTFKIDESGFVTASFEVMGAKFGTSGTSFDSTITELAGYSAFTSFHASITEGGSAIATVKSIEFTIDNSLDGDSFVIGGAGVRSAINEGKCKVSGKMTLTYSDETVFAKAIAGTESAIVVTLSKGTTPARSIAITIPEIVYDIDSPDVPNDKGLVVDCPFNAFYDNAAEATSIQFVILNGLATLG
jgi:hypothetical protein